MDPTTPLEQITEYLATLDSEQLQARLDRLEAEAHTVRSLLGVVRARERRERRLRIPGEWKEAQRA
jgi:hypothetical protein